MHHARLHDGVGEDRVNRVGQPGQAVATGDEDVLDAAVTQVRQDLLPELRSLGVLDPAAQGVLAAVHVDTDGQVGDLGGHDPVVLDPNPDSIDVEDRIHLVERTRLPSLDLVDHDIGDVRDQFPRCVHSVHFPQMRLDIPGRHATRVQRQDHVIDIADPPRPLRHDRGLERAVPVTRHLDIDWAIPG